MYSIFDRRSAIRTVQKFLTEISDTHVSQSGIYDDGTKNTVKEFQRKNGLHENGITDRTTLTLLYEEYKRTKLPTDNINFPITYGSYGNTVRKINSKINTALKYYGIKSSRRNSSYYSEETKNSVKKLRQIYNLENKEGIDELLYARLTKDTENMNVN